MLTTDDAIHSETSSVQEDVQKEAENLRILNTFSKIFIVANFSIVPPIILGNLLVLAAVVKFKHLRTVPNIFVSSLAVSDLMVGFLTIPVYVGLLYITPKSAEHRWPCTIVYALTIFPIGTSLMSLLAVSVDRYLYMVKPFAHAQYMTKNFSIGIVIFGWLYMFIQAILPALGWTSWKEENEDTECKAASVFPIAYSFMIIFHLLITLVITTILYTRVIRTAHAQSTKINSQGLREKPDLPKARPGLRLVRMFLLVIGLFYFWWAPYVTLAIVRVQTQGAEPFWLSLSCQCSIWFSFCNSFMNPIVYAVKNRPFREAFKKLLRLQRSV